LGFDVVIIDERPEFCNAERFPLAIQTCCCNFINATASLDIRSYDYAVIVSHGHRSDYSCLKQLLDGEKPSYLGMIGSRRKVKGVMDLLRNEGYDDEVLDRVCSPIGLSIGASTPEEIAISILAEMICYKRKPEECSFAQNRIVNQSDISYQTIEYLSKLTLPVPQAVITIQRNLGSSPRHTGAKMVVDREGNILSGTIGGGRGEYMAAEAAKAIIGTGQYQVLQLDLNGTADSGSKPCCGGIVEVFIEDLSQ
jgi:xanthine dehydrogenase accessory factor